MVSKQVSRKKVRETLQANYGAMAQVADDLGITRTAVWLVLKGKSKSARVMGACVALAEQLNSENNHGQHQSYPGGLAGSTATPSVRS